MRLLVIDDDEKRLKVTAGTLAADGHTVVGASSREAALVEVERAFFDVALLDL
jgi:CheY-like chemotaxis protein